MRHDVVQQLGDYRGVLHWDSYTTYSDTTAITRPALDIPLYIKDHPMPFRKPKLTELSTISITDPSSQREVGSAAIFWGSPDPLTLAISGWIITPTVNGLYNPTVDGEPGSASLGVGMLSYGEVISAYIEGRMHTTALNVRIRKDPDYYISPYGNKYLTPVVQLFDVQSTVNPRKQTFSMTMLLEK